MSFTIIVDSREKQRLDFVPDQCWSDIRVNKLSVGDYSVSGLEEVVCAERKANVDELAGNITGRRFTDCLERMSGVKYRYLVCDFPFDDVLNYPASSKIPSGGAKISSNFLLSKIAEINVQYGVTTLFCGSRAGSARLILKLFKRVYQREQGAILV